MVKVVRRGRITDNGLEPPQSFTAEVGKWYWLGASSDPKLVQITGELGTSILEYKSRGQEKPSRIERWIAQDLIAQAAATKRKEAEAMLRPEYTKVLGDEMCHAMHDNIIHILDTGTLPAVVDKE